MTRLTTHTVKLEVKSLSDTGEFEGYASVFNVEDQGQDIVRPGAFTNSLRARGSTGIKMLYEHSNLDPIGSWVDLAEDSYGLLAKGKLLIEALPKAREVHAMMKARILDGMSIGFRTVKSSNDRSNSVRYLDEVDLREISIVMFPMLELAAINSVKQADLPISTEREFERLLTQDAGFSRSDARHIMSLGFKSLLKTKQDAGREVASTPPDVDWSALADGLRGVFTT